MKKFPEKRVAITGAASGLGLALAKHFLTKGWRVALSDIQDEIALQELAKLDVDKNQAFYQHVDVTNTRDIRAWRRKIKTQWSGLDILINNAGVASQGCVEDTSIDDWDWVINTNLLGVVRGCKEFIPLFKEQSSGYIVNISSIAGILHIPEMASYGASKAGVVALSEVLQGELGADNIGVSVVCPGFFQSSLAKTARVSHPKVRQYIENILANAKYSAEDIAIKVVEGIEANGFYIMPYSDYRSIWLLKRLSPSLYLTLTREIGKRMKNRYGRWERLLT